MVIKWIKTGPKQRQASYKGQTASIYPIGTKMYHYDIWDKNNKLIYTGKNKGFGRTKRNVAKLLKGGGEYLY